MTPLKWHRTRGRNAGPGDLLNHRWRVVDLGNGKWAVVDLRTQKTAQPFFDTMRGARDYAERIALFEPDR
jgi:hypothetical protein